MSRWHHPSCDTPLVFVQGGLPYCRSCGENPDIDELIVEQANATTPWTIPPDEKPGELHLRWPASVISDPPTEDISETLAAATNEQLEILSSIDASNAVAQPIYKRRLTDAEFRILSISPAVDESYPLHAVLKDYQIDNCPEYETVSYCWGGEDGDTRRRQPVYIGDYWDVLLQTKNCWSMLQHVRYESNTRLIWVDAICINQEDHLEKDVQVPLMGQIYWKCLRTIIYLGEDVAKPKGLSLTKGKSYPKRHDFREFEDLIPNSLMTREQLFELRYFQRVWVIQEIILSPLAVIPVHGYEFRVRPGASLPPWTTQSDDLDPWMDYACTGSLSNNLLSLIQHTRSSLATDCRDKIYGILGLGHQVPALRPDYSISKLHTYIGTILHLFVVEQCVKILTAAGGHRSDSKLPSWLPDWSLEDMGERLLSVTQATRDICYYTTSQTDARSFGKQIACLDNDFFTLFNSIDDTMPPETGFTTSELWAIKKPSIDPATLKLTLPLIHVCKFSSALVEVGWIKDPTDLNEPCHVYSIEVAGYTLYVCVPDNEISVEAGDNELFLLQKGQEFTLVLFMRRLSTTGEYRLLRCTVCYDLFLSSNPSSRPPLEKIDANFDSRDFGHKYGSSILGGTVTEACHVVAPTLEMKCQDSLDEKDADRCILDMLEQMRGESETSFVDTYIAFLESLYPQCPVWNEDDMTHMILSPAQLIESCKELCLISNELEIEIHPYSETEPEGFKEWKAAKLARPEIQKATGFEDDCMECDMEIRVTEESLRGCFTRSHGREAAFVEWNCKMIFQNAESKLSSDEPWNTSHAFCYYPWPGSFYEEGQIPGRVCQVTIV
ncbi:hypothetical protein FPOAC1_007729 [Fusarium poae]|uniref:hypothetical protein n=1 Tax=Fusarium poae TaxID=36050 RepID=UPI001CE92D16|nr:hypothetical protein FPOAC1_007729 [Fusarium poae]KAG8668350.1 hypothetical protein FPOAC1_007729 [Fusarium poae]